MPEDAPGCAKVWSSNNPDCRLTDCLPRPNKNLVSGLEVVLAVVSLVVVLLTMLTTYLAVSNYRLMTVWPYVYRRHIRLQETAYTPSPSRRNIYNSPTATLSFNAGRVATVGHGRGELASIEEANEPSLSVRYFGFGDPALEIRDVHYGSRVGL